jgi:3',5'-cyclic AMP phosphodiesterase CpdA
MLAQLSDPHVQDDDSAAALAAAVRSVLELTPLPDAVLVTGDLAEHGTADEYERIRELLAPLPMPVHVIAGNHDDREALRAHFGATATAGVGDLRLVACDTTQPGRDDGRLDVAWLAARLAESDAPTIVAMHHPPLEIGIPVLDRIGLPDADRTALAALLARSPHVCRVIAGHVHRTVFGVLGGCGVVMCPSTNRQAKLEFGAEEFEFVHEPPAFAVHTRSVSHIQPVTR